MTIVKYPFVISFIDVNVNTVIVLQADRLRRFIVVDPFRIKHKICLSFFQFLTFAKLLADDRKLLILKKWKIN